LRANNAARASQIGDEASGNGIEHPMLLTLAAWRNLELNQADKAFGYASRARELDRHNPTVLSAYGACLTRVGRAREAIKVFDDALRAAPTLFVAHFNKALALEKIGELRRAREQYLRALNFVPDHAEALMHVAHLAAQRGDAKEAREYGQRALKRNPRMTTATFAVATAEIAGKQFENAVRLLDPIARDTQANANTRAIAISMIGDTLDAYGRHEAAFNMYSEAADALRAVHAPEFESMPRALNIARYLVDYFRAASPEPWRNVSPGDFKSPVRTHVFLLGFPRSGTTLLEQVLAAHPKIEAMEERACLVDSNALVLDVGGLDRLAAMDGVQLDSYRAAYWDRVAEEHGPLSRPTFIDKLPLNSVALCLIAKLFPDAKILFALRDPRDVVLSCFRRRFSMSPQMYELITLNGAAAYYDTVMTLMEVYREKLSLDLTEVRYENLVSDFDGETERLCRFLGIERSHAMADFAQKAGERHINTPSAPQVARGLFGEGAGQWRAYSAGLAPVMPVLAPWVARLGYSGQ